MTGWHVDDETLRRYVERTDSVAEGASVEQHLLTCAQCRARVNTAATAVGRAWSISPRCGTARATRSRYRARRSSSGCCAPPGSRPTRPGWSRWPAHSAACGWSAWPRFSRSPRSRRRSGTPAGSGCSWPWRRSRPCLVVAFSYDRRWDPALEPEMVTPYPALRLVLLRTIAVLALALPAVLLLGLVVPGETPFAWLLPAVGFVAVVLAASTWVSPLNAAMAVSCRLARGGLAAGRAVGFAGRGAPGPDPGGFLVLAAASFGIFLVRRRHLRQLRPWR